MFKTKLVFMILAVILPSAACQKTKTSATTSNKIKQITLADTKQAVDAKDVQFIDVRTKEEYAGGHAPKAVNFPLDDLENNLAKLDKDKPVYVICQSGRRSQKGAEILQKTGFKSLYNISGGTSAWEGAGYPMEK